MASEKETISVTFRTDKELRDMSKELFDQMGLNMGAAINMFLVQCVREWKLPFQPVGEEKADTGADLDDTEEILSEMDLRRESERRPREERNRRARRR